MAFTIKAAEKSAARGSESPVAGNSSPFVDSLLVPFSPGEDRLLAGAPDVETRKKEGEAQGGKIY